jgi:hypothetical protein
MRETTMDEFDQLAEALRAKHGLEKSPWISIKQISQVYGISIRTLRRMQAEGLMPPRTKRGRLLMYCKAEVEQTLLLGRRALRQAAR